MTLISDSRPSNSRGGILFNSIPPLELEGLARDCNMNFGINRLWNSVKHWKADDDDDEDDDDDGEGDDNDKWQKKPI